MDSTAILALVAGVIITALVAIAVIARRRRAAQADRDRSHRLHL